MFRSCGVTSGWLSRVTDNSHRCRRRPSGRTIETGSVGPKGFWTRDGSRCCRSSHGQRRSVVRPDELVRSGVVWVHVQVLAGVEQRLDVLACEHGTGPYYVELVVPLCDEERGHRVADEVDQGPALGHELVDAEDQHDRSEEHTSEL